MLKRSMNFPLLYNLIEHTWTWDMWQRERTIFKTNRTNSTRFFHRLSVGPLSLDKIWKDATSLDGTSGSSGDDGNSLMLDSEWMSLGAEEPKRRTKCGAACAKRDALSSSLHSVKFLPDFGLHSRSEFLHERALVKARSSNYKPFETHHIWYFSGLLHGSYQPWKPCHIIA